MPTRDDKLSQHDMDIKVEEFQNWINSEPQLPQNLG
jgi:hypothetical protein